MILQKMQYKCQCWFLAISQQAEEAWNHWQYQRPMSLQVVQSMTGKLCRNFPLHDNHLHCSNRLHDEPSTYCCGLNSIDTLEMTDNPRSNQEAPRWSHTSVKPAYDKSHFHHLPERDPFFHVFPPSLIRTPLYPFVWVKAVNDILPLFFRSL